MFKKGKRHFRKTLRGRGEEQESGAVANPTVSSPPIISPPVPKASKTTPEDRPLPFPYLHGMSLMPGDSSAAILMGGVGAGPSGSGEKGGDSSHKERIQTWIQEQATGFLDKWSGLSSGDPSHAITSRLKETSEGLDYNALDCLIALDVSSFGDTLVFGKGSVALRGVCK